MSLIDRRHLLLTGLLAATGCSRRANRATLYCSQDREFAEGVLSRFRSEHDAEVTVKFDTEAQKSVSLYEGLVRESERPRCDVFWNNEILNTVRLHRLGLLRPLPHTPGEPPRWTRPEHRCWQAFAARPRVLIVNTRMVPADAMPKSILQLTDPRWKNQLAIAKPQFGTTATQAACLFEVLGDAKAKDYYQGLIANQIAILPGNKPVAQAVSDGRYAIGFTDSDDAIGEIDSGRPVSLILPDRDGHSDHPKLGTLLIPNSISLINGSPNPALADQLAEYLLSADVEKSLAEGGGYQIPLNSAVKAMLHPALNDAQHAKPMQVDWERACDLWTTTQDFLRDKFAR